MRFGAALGTLLLLAACSGSPGSPLQRAADVEPKLRPNAVPIGLELRTTVSRNFFTLTWTGADRSVELAVRVTTLPSAGAEERAFRHDKRAVYRVDGANRELVWQEPGRWTSHVPGTRGDIVPYDLRTRGIAEDEFWRIAGSIREDS